MKKTVLTTLSALITIGFAIAILSPLGQLLRTQHPWSCFQTTYDENYFLQAIVNWSEGSGYRQHGESKPFDGKITVGLPMAWGTAAIHKLTSADWPQAGRLWVYLCTLALLYLIGRAALLRSRSTSRDGSDVAPEWGAPLLALAVFGYLLTQAKAANYLVFGILGEIPGALAVWIALRWLDRGAVIRAALMGVLAFWIKPTYLFAIPAIAFAAVFNGIRPALKAGVAGGLGAGALLLYIASVRNEGFGEYLSHFLAIARSVSGAAGTDAAGSLWDYYREASAAIWIASALILGFGLRPKVPSERAAGAFLAIGALYFLAQGVKPMDKHWFVFLVPGLAVVSVRLGLWLGSWTTRLLGNDRIQVAAMAVILTWIFNVPGLNRRAFVRADVSDCAVKEQREIGRQLLESQGLGDLKQGDVAYVIESGATWFLYELGWNPPEHRRWADAATPPPRWVVGDLPTLSQGMPTGCSIAWRGSLYALAKCEKTPEPRSKADSGVKDHYRQK